MNRNSTYDPAVDPAGFYMDGGSLATVTIANGSDVFDVDIEILDPALFSGAPSGWHIPALDGENAARAEQWRLLREHIDRLLAARR